MTILATAPPLPAPPAPRSNDEQRFLLRNVSWEAYVAIGEALRDRAGLRITYDSGSLELMTTSAEHETYKQRLGRFLETLAEETRTEILPCGNMTFQREDLERGLEPDQCYWIAHEPDMRGKLTWDANIDPPPDLVLEIEVSHGALNKMSIYAALGVPEVWRFDGAALHIHRLQANKAYQEVTNSPTFPGFPVAGIARFVPPSAAMGYLAEVGAFRAWVRQQLTTPPGAPSTP